MSGKTAGQAAYEAFDAVLGEVDGYTPGELPSIAWRHVPDTEQDAWEAAAKAGTVTAWRLLDEARAELNRVTAERDELRDKLADETYDNAPAELLTAMSQVDYFRELVREILGSVEAISDRAGMRANIAIWRKRAGIEPAIMGAGTGYLVAELAEEGR